VFPSAPIAAEWHGEQSRSRRGASTPLKRKAEGFLWKAALAAWAARRRLYACHAEAEWGRGLERSGGGRSELRSQDLAPLRRRWRV